MSEKVELVAAAQVNVVVGDPNPVTFNSSFGFEAAATTGQGVYVLTLEHKHGAEKLDIQATRLNTTPGEISAIAVGTGDTKTIQVSTFDETGAPFDSSFSISVQRIRS